MNRTCVPRVARIGGTPKKDIKKPLNNPQIIEISKPARMAKSITRPADAAPSPGAPNLVRIRAMIVPHRFVIDKRYESLLLTQELPLEGRHLSVVSNDVIHTEI